MAGWVAAIAALVALWLTIHYRKSDADIAKVNELLKPMQVELAKHDKYHSQHFNNARANAADIASLKQQAADHLAHDEERFERIELMHREIRDDIKELLQR